MTAANQQGLFYLLYWTWLHNYQVIALVFGCLLAIGLMLKTPKRLYLLFFLGFLLLVLQFEYLKHFQEHLEEQTLQTAVINETQSKAKKAIDLFFNRLVPFALYLGGWGLIFIGMILGGRKQKNKL
jgi:hypothetical protein